MRSDRRCVTDRRISPREKRPPVDCLQAVSQATVSQLSQRSTRRRRETAWETVIFVAITLSRCRPPSLAICSFPEPDDNDCQRHESIKELGHEIKSNVDQTRRPQGGCQLYLPCPHRYHRHRKRVARDTRNADTTGRPARGRLRNPGGERNWAQSPAAERISHWYLLRTLVQRRLTHRYHPTTGKGPLLFDDVLMRLPAVAHAAHD